MSEDRELFVPLPAGRPIPVDLNHAATASAEVVQLRRENAELRAHAREVTDAAAVLIAARGRDLFARNNDVDRVARERDDLRKASTKLARDLLASRDRFTSLRNAIVELRDRLAKDAAASRLAADNQDVAGQAATAQSHRDQARADEAAVINLDTILKGC